MKYTFVKYEIPNDRSSLITLKENIELKDNFAVDDFLNKEHDVKITLGADFEFNEKPSRYIIYDYDGKARYELVAQRTDSDILNEALFNPDLLTMDEAKKVINAYRSLVDAIKHIEFNKSYYNNPEERLFDINSNIAQTEFHLTGILKRLAE